MIFPGKKKQYGIITYGHGINHAQWIADAKAEGYTIVYCIGYAQLWK